RISRSDKRYAFVTLSDQSGVYDVTMFAEVLAVARPLLEPGTPVLMTVEVQPQEDGFRLTCHDIQSLDTAVANAGAAIRVYLREPAAVGPLQAILEREGRGRGQVTVLVPLDDD